MAKTKTCRNCKHWEQLKGQPMWGWCGSRSVQIRLALMCDRHARQDFGCRFFKEKATLTDIAKIADKAAERIAQETYFMLCEWHGLHVSHDPETPERAKLRGGLLCIQVSISILAKRIIREEMEAAEAEELKQDAEMKAEIDAIATNASTGNVNLNDWLPDADELDKLLDE